MPRDLCTAIYKQIDLSFIPFANANYVDTHWWGVTVGLKYTDFKAIYRQNYHGLISKLSDFLRGTLGTVISVIAVVIQAIMDVLNYLNERDRKGIWIQFYWAGVPFKWGSQK